MCGFRTFRQGVGVLTAFLLYFLRCKATCDFPGGGGGVRTPCPLLEPPMILAHIKCKPKCVFMNYFLFKLCMLILLKAPCQGHRTFKTAKNKTITMKYVQTNIFYLKLLMTCGDNSRASAC